MKRIANLFMLTWLVFQGCGKQIALKPGIDDFQVTLEKTTFKAGEEINFRLKGQPDLITFYSGEVLHQYAFKGGRTIKLDSAVLSFTTSKPATASAQENQFFVMASTDFNGNYSDFSSIEAATWTDITDRFELSTTVTFLPSGEVDIADLLAEGKPLYIAFRYVSYPQDRGRVGTWHVQNFALTGHTAVGPLTLGDMKESGFTLLDQHPEAAPSQSKMTASRITLYGNPDVDLSTECWAISKAFETGETDLGPDLPVAIKGMESAPLETYTYIYNEPGTYTATFVATNSTVHESERVIREVEVTITD